MNHLEGNEGLSNQERFSHVITSLAKAITALRVSMDGGSRYWPEDILRELVELNDPELTKALSIALQKEAKHEEAGHYGDRDTIARLLKTVDKDKAKALQKRVLIQQMGLSLTGYKNVQKPNDMVEATSMVDTLVEEGLLSREEADERLRRFQEILSQ